MKSPIECRQERSLWMQSRHPTMPNITLGREDWMDVIAYILSHKDKGRPDNQ